MNERLRLPREKAPQVTYHTLPGSDPKKGQISCICHRRSTQLALPLLIPSSNQPWTTHFSNGVWINKNQLPNKDMAIKPNFRTFWEATITRLPYYHISHLLQLQACLPIQIPNVDAGGQRKPPGPPGLAANWHPTGAWFGKGSRNIQAPSIRLKLCGLRSPW